MIQLGTKRTSLAIIVCLLFSCTASHVTTSEIEKQASSITIPYYPLEDEKDLNVLISQIGDARIVLLGESTHGTSEYYQWRSAITKKLIQEKRFDFIGVEGDWTDSYKVNEFISGPQRDSGAAVKVLEQYDRWPQSMWGNYEMTSLVTWLNHYNDGRQSNEKVGFYGLDVYSFWKWTSSHTNVADSAIRDAINRVNDTFSRFNNDALKYSAAVQTSGTDYHEITEDLWRKTQHFTAKYPNDQSSFLLEQQALLALQGERYFRTMVNNRMQSWNIRDNYMAATIKRLLNLHGKNSKAIIWVHNGHAGDAQYSNMGISGYTSVGEILRKEFGRKKIFSTAFGTNKGSVMAGDSWDAPIRTQTVLPAKAGSWESILHELTPANKIILSRDIEKNNSLNKWIEFRSIGASYRGTSGYGRSIIPQRFDAFIFIDSTTAVHPIRK